MLFYSIRNYGYKFLKSKPIAPQNNVITNNQLKLFDNNY